MSHTKKGDKIKQVERIGLDSAKRSFQGHGVDAHGKVVIRKQLTRGQVLGYFVQLPPCLVGVEACGGSKKLCYLLHYAEPRFGHRTPLSKSPRAMRGPLS